MLSTRYNTELTFYKVFSVRVRTKICGITSAKDALQAVKSGADALGFVFYKPSPRYIDVQSVLEICEILPPFVTTVGLFVNADQNEIEFATKEAELSLLQFHGDELEAECDRYMLPYIKAIRVQTTQDVIEAESGFQSAQAILVDAYKKGVPGGTGERFDWSLLPENRNKPLVLAGGLKAENVYQAIQSVRPYAVDVSGGVELTNGIKDHEKVSRFIEEVSRASE